MDKKIEPQPETQKIYPFEKSGNFRRIGLIDDKKFTKIIKVQSTNDIKQEMNSKFYAIKIFKKFQHINIEPCTNYKISKLRELLKNPIQVDDMNQNQILSYISDSLSIKAINEINILQSLSHPNILKFIELKQDYMNGIWMLIDYFPMNIGEFFKRKSSISQVITESFFKSIAIQIIRGVSYLHENLIVHRNLKQSTIMYDEEKNHILISGFSSSKKLSFSCSINDDKNIGTVAYKPPDVLLGNNYYGCSFDVWSIGCILVELVIGRLLFQGNSEFEVLN